MTDPKYTSPDEFNSTFPPGQSIQSIASHSKDVIGVPTFPHNTTGDYSPIEATLIDQLCRAEAIVRDLAALDDLRQLNNPEGREKFRQLIERANELLERE